jgi:chromosome segregation protein
LTTLEEIQRNYEGYDRGVRAVMRQAGESPREVGIYGLVTDVLNATPRAEKAIEAALGERLQHVVVDSRERGILLADFLKAGAEGRSTFVPLAAPAPESVPVDLTFVPEEVLAPVAEAVPVSDITFIPEPVESSWFAAPETAVAVPEAAPAPAPGWVARAIDEVSCEDAFRPLVATLLGGVVIFTDLSAARAYAQGEGAGHTLVTLDGEVLHADGAVTGGTLEGPAIGALHKKREIAELTDAVVAAEAVYNEVITRHYGLQKELGHTEGVLKGLAKNQHTEELNLTSQEKDLHKAHEDLARIQERVAALDGERQELAAALATVETEEGASRGAVAHGQTDREAREERLRQMGAELDALERRARTVSDELTLIRVKVAENVQRQEALQRELEQLAAQRAEVQVRAERRMEESAEGERRLEELRLRAEETRRLRDERGTERNALAAELDAQRQAHAQLQASVREEETRLRELRARLDELSQGLSQISIQERELSIELSHLVEQIRERHQAELAYELHAYHLLPVLSEEATQKLKDLRGQIERMGEINVTAIEEHAELSKRHAFLFGQRSDLEASMNQLKSAIQKINRTSKDRFAQTFESVNEKFQQVFPRLFGGGRAGLVLTEEAPGVEAGVEIVAQPPGKKLQNVTLLSGGEKALTAVALIFAIFLIKPTPFCLLDEVDAPLDDANVGRYNDIVREMSRQSQFILITHNKRTMEIGDTLYGVTMEEPGISKLVSVRMREASAANDNAA